jgi:hypothetical protein
MHEEGQQAKQCSEIIQLTTDNLGNKTLQLLLVSVQQVNITLCVKYTLERYHHVLHNKGMFNHCSNCSKGLQIMLKDYTQDMELVSLWGSSGGSIAQNRAGRLLQQLREFKVGILPEIWAYHLRCFSATTLLK